MLEEDNEKRYCYKDLSLFNINDAGSIIQKVMINGKEMSIKEFKKSKGSAIGLYSRKRRLGIPDRS